MIHGNTVGQAFLGVGEEFIITTSNDNNPGWLSGKENVLIRLARACSFAYTVPTRISKEGGKNV